MLYLSSIGVENEGVGPKMSIQYDPIPDSSIYTGVWYFYQFLPFLTNFIDLGLNFVLPNHFRCLKVIYSSSAV